MVNTMGWNERSDPDMRTANFCDVYREGVYWICPIVFTSQQFIVLTLWATLSQDQEICAAQTLIFALYCSGTVL